MSHGGNGRDHAHSSHEREHRHKERTAPSSSSTTDDLADIFGTERDKVNCPFYWKIGACRHGETCSRVHNKPPFSPTILLPHMYPNPQATPAINAQGLPVEIDKKTLKKHFDEFYEDIYDELSKHGTVKELNVCDNMCEHLLGNVYVKYETSDQAGEALNSLKDRFYAGRVLKPEFSPVVDFKEAKCKDHVTDECIRGGMCNFMHLKVPSRTLTRELFGYDKFKDMRQGSKKKEREDDDRYGYDRDNYRRHSSSSSSSSSKRSRDYDDGGRGYSSHRDRERERDPYYSSRDSSSRDRYYAEHEGRDRDHYSSSSHYKRRRSDGADDRQPHSPSQYAYYYDTQGHRDPRAYADYYAAHQQGGAVPAEGVAPASTEYSGYDATYADPYASDPYASYHTTAPQPPHQQSGTISANEQAQTSAVASEQQ